jgi:hypothetical protein
MNADEHNAARTPPLPINQSASSPGLRPPCPVTGRAGFLPPKGKARWKTGRQESRPSIGYGVHGANLRFGAFSPPFGMEEGRGGEALKYKGSKR